jgi:hypothetical protein
VNMGAGAGAGDDVPDTDERDAGAAQLLHEPAPVRAVRVHGDVERRAVIEAEPLVDLRLSEGADRQAARRPAMPVGSVSAGGPGSTSRPASCRSRRPSSRP